MSKNSGPENLNDQLAAVQRQEFEHLCGQKISVSAAAEKYGLHRNTVLEWFKRCYIKPLTPSKGRGSRMYLDEADVAYCARVQALRQRAGVYAGVPLLDGEGRPYLLKHPKLSQVRRQRRGA